MAFTSARMTCLPKLRESYWATEAIIGYSTHNVEQAQQASKLPDRLLAIGPIFATATKSDTSPDARSRRIAGRPTRPSVTSRSWQSAELLTTNARDVIEAGADSVAVISALLSDPRSHN